MKNAMTWALAAILLATGSTRAMAQEAVPASQPPAPEPLKIHRAQFNMQACDATVRGAYQGILDFVAAEPPSPKAGVHGLIAAGINRYADQLTKGFGNHMPTDTNAPDVQKNFGIYCNAVSNYSSMMAVFLGIEGFKPAEDKDAGAQKPEIGKTVTRYNVRSCPADIVRAYDDLGHSIATKVVIPPLEASQRMPEDDSKFRDALALSGNMIQLANAGLTQKSSDMAEEFTRQNNKTEEEGLQTFCELIDLHTRMLNPEVASYDNEYKKTGLPRPKPPGKEL